MPGSPLPRAGLQACSTQDPTPGVLLSPARDLHRASAAAGQAPDPKGTLRVEGSRLIDFFFFFGSRINTVKSVGQSKLN